MDTSLVEQAPNITARDIDVNDTIVLTDSLKDIDVVVSAFNAGWTNPNLYNDFLKGANNIQQAVKASGASRLIVIG